MESNYHYNLNASRSFFDNINEKNVIKSNKGKLRHLKDEIESNLKLLKSSDDKDSERIAKGNRLISNISKIFNESKVMSKSEFNINISDNYTHPKFRKITEKMEFGLKPSPDIRVTPPIHYIKGERRTRDLIPAKKQILGKGGYGSVYEHRDDPSRVIKKSKKLESLKNNGEFKLGNILNHPNLVRAHRLYIKHYPNGTKYKIDMEKVDGIALKNLTTNISLTEAEQLIHQARNLCHYLFQNGVTWSDINAGNIMIENNTKILKIIDYGDWSEISNPKELSLNLLLGAMELTQTILDYADLTHETRFEMAFPKQIFNTQIKERIRQFDIQDYQKKPWFTYIESNLEKMNIQQMENFLKGYFDLVLQSLDKPH